jgi:hypothetical protein
VEIITKTTMELMSGDIVRIRKPSQPGKFNGMLSDALYLGFLTFEGWGQTIAVIFHGDTTYTKLWYWHAEEFDVILSAKR